MWAIDENMSTNLQAVTSIFLHRLSENTKTAITFCEFLYINNSGIALEIIGQGARQYWQGAAPLEICLAGTLTHTPSRPLYEDRNINKTPHEMTR